MQSDSLVPLGLHSVAISTICAVYICYFGDVFVNWNNWGIRRVHKMSVLTFCMCIYGGTMWELGCIIDRWRFNDRVLQSTDTAAVLSLAVVMLTGWMRVSKRSKLLTSVMMQLAGFGLMYVVDFASQKDASLLGAQVPLNLVSCLWTTRLFLSFYKQTRLCERVMSD